MTAPALPQHLDPNANLPTTYLVSRHPGALQWLRARLGPAGHHAVVLAHLPEDFQAPPGSKVLGVLPLAWLERLQAQGAQPWVLDVSLPPELRGQELSAAQLDALGARLVRYGVRRLGER